MIPDLLQRAEAHMMKEELAEAERLCRQVLSMDPLNPGGLYRLGLLAAHAQRYRQAANLITDAIENQTVAPVMMHFDLARVFFHMACYSQALLEADRVLEREPQHVGGLQYRGLCLKALRRDEEALQTYERALALRPQWADLHYNMANALKDMHRLEEASQHYLTAIKILEPLADAAHIKLLANVHNNLGRLLSGIYENDKAVEHFRAATRLDPGFGVAYVNCGNSLRHIGRLEEARASYRQALAINPSSTMARWAEILGYLPTFFERAEDIDPVRAQFQEKLAELDQWFASLPAVEGDGGIGEAMLFSLAYQERNNRDILSAYGRLCARIMKNWFEPKYFNDSLNVSIDRPLRLGMVSSHFREHSVWNAITKGWLKYMDPQKIEIHLFSCKLLEDEETAWAKQKAASYQVLEPEDSVGVKTILQRDPDILIYPEIGMDPQVLKYASLRLAPVQIAAWGHPETTGLPTMDYYLSAEDFEPPEADDYYVEKLVRLPRFGCCYTPPDVKSETVDLSSLGIKVDRPLLVSPGLTIKYAPEKDHVYVDIARRVGPCQIVFFIGPDGLANKFRERLSKVFAREKVSFEDTCVFIPWQKPPVFYGLLEKATVFLDTMGFSGFNTAIQAVQCATPLVAWRGRFMRGRFASGILHRLGLDELIADDAESYVSLVHKLVHEPDYRARVHQTLIERRTGLWDDQETVRVFEEFLLKVRKQ